MLQSHICRRGTRRLRGLVVAVAAHTVTTHAVCISDDSCSDDSCSGGSPAPGWRLRWAWRRTLRTVHQWGHQAPSQPWHGPLWGTKSDRQQPHGTVQASEANTSRSCSIVAGNMQPLPGADRRVIQQAITATTEVLSQRTATNIPAHPQLGLRGYLINTQVYGMRS